MIESLQEVVERLVSSVQVEENLRAHRAVILKGRDRSVAIGEGLLTKVNCNVGCSTLRAAPEEMNKVATLSSLGYRPDTMMDLSIVRPKKPLYEYIIEECGCPVGTLPHYLCYHPKRGIDPTELLEEIDRQGEAGVGWMTLHLTERKDLYELAKKTRLTPVTARGGGLVIRDMYLHGRSEGIISLVFPDVLQILKKHGVTLSVGTTFRPSNVADALDEVHRTEIELQGIYIAEAKRQGVQVMMEGVGHMTLDKIADYTHLIKQKYGVPMVPLGPIPTDAAVGEDHVSNAIGAAFMAHIGGAAMVNCVTREEHTGKVPSTESVIEGVKAARIAAHAVNIARFPSLDRVDRYLAGKRAQNYTCVVEGGLFSESSKVRYSMGCTRCGKECPLLINYMLEDPDKIVSVREARIRGTEV